MAESFYGGQKGQSFEIIKSYSSVAEMLSDFGSASCSVGYGQYVFIDSTDDTNAQIYRRGTNISINNGAEYIGQIRGSSGGGSGQIITSASIGLFPYNEITGTNIQKGEFAIDNDSLVPGKINDSYNDSIKYKTKKVTDENGNVETQIGLSIPYSVIEFDTQFIEDYTNFDINNALKLDENESHPFYQKWHLQLPPGIKGDSIKNIKVIVPKAGDLIYDADTKELYSDLNDDILNKQEIFIYELIDYMSDKAGTSTKYYLGKYNQIKDVTVDENGIVTFIYNENKQDSFKLKIVKNISLSNDGILSVLYNTSDTPVKLNEENPIKWITAVELTDEGVFKITYNTSVAPIEIKSDIRWIKDCSFIDNNLTITYNDNTFDTFYNLVKSIGDITLSEDGILTIKFSDGVTALTKQLPYPTKLNFDSGETEGAGTQTLTVTYNGSEESQQISPPINYIMRTALSDDYHLLFLYSDPARRKQVILNGNNYSYDGRDDWEDMGSIKDKSGLLIGKTIYITSSSDLNDINNAITYLNENYPNGLDGGKIIAIGIEDSYKTLFAFNYDYDEIITDQFIGWYYLGEMVNQASVLVAEETAGVQADSLPTGGIWLILED